MVKNLLYTLRHLRDKEYIILEEGYYTGLEITGHGTTVLDEPCHDVKVSFGWLNEATLRCILLAYNQQDGTTKHYRIKITYSNTFFFFWGLPNV